MRLVWGLGARRDFIELISYIAEQNPQTAELVANRIDKAVELLTRMPQVGRGGRVGGTRELVVQRTPYILVYRFNMDVVHILRIFRGARDWPSRFD